MMSSDREDRRPTFQQLRLAHRLTVEMLYGAAMRSVEMEAIERFEETGYGEPHEIETILHALSNLAGRIYERSDISNIHFILSAGGQPHPQPRPDFPLPVRPTLVQIQTAYDLKLSHLAEAANLEVFEVYRMMILKPVRLEAIQKVLQIISDYTEVEWTRENVETLAEEDEEDEKKEEIG